MNMNVNFKNLKFSLDTERIEKPEPVTTFEDYRPWNILSPDYLEDAFPLHVGNAAMIFFTHIGATKEEQKDDGCGCDSCHNEEPKKVDRRFADKKTKEKNLKEMHDIAASKRGKCFATEWGGVNCKMEFECSEGHRWWAMPGNVRQGKWCKICHDKRKNLTIDDFHGIAKQSDGLCLSKIYNPKEKLEFECKRRHRWFASAGHIVEGKWCRKCWEIDNKPTIEEIRQWANSMGGKCLSTTYVDSKTKLEFECDKKHRWTAKPSCITWCPVCAGNSPSNIFEMQEISESRGGYCRSIEFIDNRTKLEFECAKGHRWWATPTSIKCAKSWCAKCSWEVDRKQLTIQDFQKIAESNSGKCLSLTYESHKIKLEFECKNGHRWWAYSQGIRKGYWCPECMCAKKLTIEEFQEIATAKCGKCLSTVYVNISTKLEFECKDGFKWWATPDSIKRGHWCPHCAGHGVGSIDEMQEFAMLKNGRCLATEYIDRMTKLLFECSAGHQFMASPKTIVDGHWCPHCNEYSSEIRSRFIFEYITGEKFPKNKKTVAMELDGYCEKLNLAFEYQGQQHYYHVKWFHKTVEDFQKQQKRDAQKRNLCKEKNIQLIEIPYHQAIDNATLSQFIYDELILRGIPVVALPSQIDFKNSKMAQSKIDEVRKIVHSKGGKLFTEIYENGNTVLSLMCGENHTWETRATNIKRGFWCPTCGNLSRSEKTKERKKKKN